MRSSSSRETTKGERRERDKKKSGNDTEGFFETLDLFITLPFINPKVLSIHTFTSQCRNIEIDFHYLPWHTDAAEGERAAERRERDCVNK